MGPTSALAERLFWMMDSLRETGELRYEHWAEHFPRGKKTFENDIKFLKEYHLKKSGTLTYSRREGNYSSTLFPRKRGSFEFLKRHLVTEPETPESVKNWDTLKQALETGVKVSFTYQPPDQQPKEHKGVALWALLDYDGIRYLAGQLSHRGLAKPTLFRLSRISNVERVFNTKFSPLPAELESWRKTLDVFGIYLGANTPAPQEVQIRFWGNEIVNYVKKLEFHPGQRRELHLEAEIPYADFFIRVWQFTEIVSYVLSWGGSAEAVSPPEFRSLWKQKLAEALRKANATDL
ncbi:MAG: WYL domain-containing protein [Spirochaetales bacterium]|nr:WYL domain-containing protein [Spirochaetales bacterium]